MADRIKTIKLLVDLQENGIIRLHETGRLIGRLTVDNEAKFEKISEKAIDLRTEVIKFANAMENKLKENDYKGGWKNCSAKYLVNKLDEEVGELMSAICDETPHKILHEAADVGNIAMMIADIYDGLK